MSSVSLDALSAPLDLDPQDMLSSIGMLADQLEHAWEGVAAVDVPESYREVDRLVVFGMGGSALGTDVIQHLFVRELSIPVTIVNDYTVPGWVNERTLVLLSSYSGSTEEVVAAAKEAVSRTNKVLAITTGKDIEALAEEHGFPLYKIDPVYNPCGQPRIAVGYSIMAQIAFLSKLGLIPFTKDDMRRASAFVRNLVGMYGPDVVTADNLAKQAAEAFAETMPVLVASEHLQGIAHVFRNQVNENGKHMAALLPIPEMNHHAMEGLGFPRVTSSLHFLLLESSLYGERNQKRYEVLTSVLEKQNPSFSRVAIAGETRVEQAFALLLFGGYVSFYVAMLHGIDPSPIPWVDTFKAELGK